LTNYPVVVGRGGVACVPALSFPFPRGEIEQASKKAPGVSKNMGEAGRRWLEGGGGPSP